MENVSGSRFPLMTPLLGSQPQITVEGTGNDGVVVNNVSPHDGGRLQQSTRASNANRRIGEASVSLRRSSNGRFMSEQSLAVRETAAEHLEERQSDWAYSRPVVVLDLLWNLIFVVVAGVVLVIGRTEKPPTPLRVWVGGYALQCALHMLFVGTEYRRRQQRAGSAIRGGARGGSRGSSRAAGTGARRRDGFENAGNVRATRDGHSDSDSSWDSDSDSDDVTDGASCAKRMESANTMFSFAWWILGFYWLTLNADTRSVAPTLYWLVVVFLAFDVFFVVFCIALACVIGIAVCCCLPCIIAILYAVADPEGASEDDIGSLPLYNYRPARDGLCVPERGLQRPSKGTMVPIGNGGSERDISVEDAECCICLSAYEDGVELRGLPCLHHFHSACIDKWLRAKATCPLCKYNIVRNGNAAEEP